MLTALTKELIAVKHNECVLYTLFWQHVSTQYSHLQADNIKFIKVLYTNY